MLMSPLPSCSCRVVHTPCWRSGEHGGGEHYCSQQRRPGRVPRFLGAYRHRQYTVPLCLGVRDPGIAELRSIRVVYTVYGDRCYLYSPSPSYRIVGVRDALSSGPKQATPLMQVVNQSTARGINATRERKDSLVRRLKCSPWSSAAGYLFLETFSLNPKSGGEPKRRIQF
eukprot:scaffold6581_cov31-Phaeocystis_antarctica.AAC.1